MKKLKSKYKYADRINHFHSLMLIRDIIRNMERAVGISESKLKNDYYVTDGIKEFILEKTKK